MSALSVSLAGLGLATPGRLERQLQEAVAGEFEVVRLIARGGMGLVFLGRDVHLRREVAIKVLMSDSFTTESEIERFKREAQTVAALNHPNIVPVYSVREHEGLLLYIMQYVDGETLEQHIARGPMEPERVVSILHDVGAALDHAHSLNIIHRDVKPANIILDRVGRPFVTDFGIAKLPDRQDLTMAGTLVGTPIYASPEQCRGESGVPGSDQYAMGVLAYEMIAGAPPFEADSLPAMIGHHLDSPPPSLLDRVQDCPPALASAVSRMLAKRPEDRWPTITAAAEAARSSSVDASGDEPDADMLVTPARRTRPRAKAVLLAVAALSLTLAALTPTVLGGPTEAETTTEALSLASPADPVSTPEVPGEDDAALRSLDAPAEPDEEREEVVPSPVPVDSGPSSPAPRQSRKAPPAHDLPQAPGSVLVGTRGVAAVLYINEQPLGAASRLRAWEVEPGRATISLRAEGCTSWDSTVVVQPGAEVRIGYRLQNCGR